MHNATIVVVTTIVNAIVRLSETNGINLERRDQGLPGLLNGRICTWLTKLFALCVTIMATTCATSSGDSTFDASLGPLPENSVATLPGQTVLTRIPCPLRFSAMQADRPCRPHLEAQ